MPGSDILIERMARDEMLVEDLGELVTAKVDGGLIGAQKIPVEIVPPKLNRHQRRALAAQQRIEERKRKKAKKGGKP